MKFYIYILALFCLTLTGCINNKSDDNSNVASQNIKTGSLFGKVFDSPNTPSTGVVVFAQPVASLTQAAPQKTQNTSTYTTITNSDGYYAINNIPEGKYMVIAKKSDHMQATKMNITVKQNTVTDLGQIDITPTGNLSGVVTFHGNPAANVNIAILGSSYSAITNSSGAYTIANIPEGSYTITAMLIDSSVKGNLMASKAGTVVKATTSTVDTIEISNSFYVVAGPKEMHDLTDNGTGIDTDVSDIEFYFSNYPKSADDIKSALSISPNDKSYDITVALSGSMATVNFIPASGFSQELESNTTYTITIGTTLTNTSNTPLSSAYSFTFTTKAPVSSNIKKISPTDRSAMCPSSTSMKIYFSSLMDRASVEESLTVKNASGTTVTVNFDWVSDTANDLDILSIAPSNDAKNVYAPTHLAEAETYTVAVGGKTFSGTAITSYSFTFATHAEGEYITTNTTWSSDKTLKCPVYVTGGATLTINSGVNVTFDGYSLYYYKYY